MRCHASLYAAVGVHSVIDEQDEAAEGGRVQRERRLEPAQLDAASAAVAPVLAEVQDVGSDQPQVVHRLKLSPWTR